MKDGHFSILGTDIPGLSPYEPMAIVQTPIVQVEIPSIPEGRYVIKNRAADILWTGWNIAESKVYFWTGTLASAGTNPISIKVNEHFLTIQVFKL